MRVRYLLVRLWQKEDSKGSDEGLEVVAKKKKKKKGQTEDDDEMDLESLDWWSKYFASVETMIRVSKLTITDVPVLIMQFNGIDVLEFFSWYVNGILFCSGTDRQSCLFIWTTNIHSVLDTVYI